MRKSKFSKKRIFIENKILQYIHHLKEEVSLFNFDKARVILCVTFFV
jgi:hypothetical protein